MKKPYMSSNIASFRALERKAKTTGLKNAPSFFSENIKALREAQKLSKKEMAAALDIPYTTYNNYETTTSLPNNIFLLSNIAAVLNTDLNTLFDFYKILETFPVYLCSLIKTEAEPFFANRKLLVSYPNDDTILLTESLSAHPQSYKFSYQQWACVIFRTATEWVKSSGWREEYKLKEYTILEKLFNKILDEEIIFPKKKK